MRSLYFISVAFSCIMLFALAHATTLRQIADVSNISTSTSTTKLSTSTTGHSSQVTTPFCDCSLFPPTTMQSSVAGKQSTTTTQTKQSITSTVQSSANLTPSLSNTMKPSSSPITVTSTSTASSTSTSQTTPTTSQSASTSQTSPSTSTSQASPATRQLTSTSQASPATSPSTSASQTSPATSPSTSTSQTSPATSQSASTSQTSPATSPSTSTSQTSPTTSPATSTIQTSPATSPATSTTQTSPTTSPATSTSQTSPATSPSTSTAQTSPTTSPATSTSQTSPATSPATSTIQTSPATSPATSTTQTSPTTSPSTSTSQTSPATSQSASTSQTSPATSPSTSTSQTSPTTSPATSTIQTSPATSPATSTTQTSPTTSPATSTSQTSPATSPSTSTAQTSPTTSPATSTSQTSPATSPATSTIQTSPATSPATSTTQTSPTTSPATSTIQTSPATSPSTSTTQTSPTTVSSTSLTTASPTTTKINPANAINPIATTSSMTSTSSTVARLKRARRFSNDEQNYIMNSSDKHIHCYRVCNNITNSTPISTTETTTISTTSPTETTTFIPRYRAVDLSDTTVEVALVVFVNGSFTDVPKNSSSKTYKTFAEKFSYSLTQFYKDILGNRFKGIVINGFSEGSIKCNFTIEMKAPTNKSEAKTVLDDMRNASWSSFNVTGIPGPVLVNETRNQQNNVLEDVDDLLHVRIGEYVCGKQAVLRFDSNNNGDAICVYRCDDIDIKKLDCGAHGDCVVTYTGHVKCLCKDDNNEGYHGDSCKMTIPVQAPTTVKTEVVTESLSRTDIIAIAAGTGGALVLLLLISLVCVCKRLQSAEKRNKFYSYMRNDKEALHSDNSRIEHVPSLNNDHTNMCYIRDSNYMQLQHFEPEGKNVDHETGQRQGYERYEKSYRKVETLEVGNVTIYQPSHLKEPIDRHSGASKFDREEVQSHPLHMMDTEKSYKIRRPTVNSDKSINYN